MSNLDAVPEEFAAACVQFDVRKGDVANNLAEAQRGLRAAAAAGARLAVLPEMWPTSYVQDPKTALLAASRAAEDAIVALSGELGMVVVGSGFDAEDGKLWNRAIVADHGRVLGRYRKIHLFTPNAEHKLFAPGDTPLVVDTSAGRLGVLICYDIRFPELVRWMFHRKVEVLAVPAQWPESRAAHWRALTLARAIENQCFVVGCNRTGVEPSFRTGEPLLYPGDSRIVDPMGEVLAGGAGESGPVLGAVSVRKSQMMRRILPVAKDRRPDVYRALWERVWNEGTPKS